MANPTTSGNPQRLKAQDLTKSPLPEISWSDQRTFSGSMNPHVFVGLMAKWHNFEMEVRQNFRRQKWQNANETLSYDPDPLNIDRVKCATEAGVTGRFLQHVGQVMSCVGHELSLPLWFGDWQGGSKDIPDVTIWKENKPKPSARVAGEMKAPWTCDLRTLMSNSDHDDSEAVEQFEEDFSAWAGQVANYMSTYKYKYGFLSTYEETIFFKQERHRLTGEWAKANEVDDGKEVTVLYYSNAVHHNTKFETPQDVQDPREFRDNVTVRECMLYLMTESKSYPDPQVDKSWTKLRVNGGRKGNHLVPKPPKEKNSPDSSTSQQSSSKGKAPQQRSYTAGKSLAQKMNGLSVEDPKAAKEKYMKYKPATVRWDKGLKTYTWRKGDERGKVDKYATLHGILLVTIRGNNYRGIEASD